LFTFITAILDGGTVKMQTGRELTDWKKGSSIFIISTTHKLSIILFYALFPGHG